MKLIKQIIIISTIVTYGFSSTALIKEDANVRLEPTVKSKVVKVFLKDKQVNVLDTIYTKENQKWYKIEEGYIYAELLRKITIADKSLIYIPQKEEKEIVEVKKEKQLTTILKETNTVKNVNTLEENIEQKNFFLGVTLGYSNLNVSKNDSIPVNGTLENSGANLNLEIGYNYTENIDVSFN